MDGMSTHWCPNVRSAMAPGKRREVGVFSQRFLAIGILLDRRAGLVEAAEEVQGAGLAPERAGVAKADQRFLVALELEQRVAAVVPEAGQIVAHQAFVVAVQ